jgi:ribosomal protein S18 acetylase RimI-like enzyme
MRIDYRKDVPLKVEDVVRVFDASGLKRPTADLARIGRMFAGSNLVISAWDGAQLVGVSRAVTDFSYSCYLSDLAVDPAYQGKGIGRELVRLTREAVGEEVMLLLLAAPRAMSYYPALGFEKADNAFAIRRLR